VVAAASDLADGRLARRQSSVTLFGAYADSLADAAFWTWLTLRHQPNRAVRAAALAAWTLPVGAIAVASLARAAEWSKDHALRSCAPQPPCRRLSRCAVWPDPDLPQQGIRFTGSP
jgi:phosphatidylglycerophosphate synthase